MKPPKVTVLMPVYNAEKFLAQAIESILSQTFRDFEFLIIDDGSSDQSLDIIKGFGVQDKRIRVVARKNKGLVATLNEGLSIAQGKYVARQDADDISEKKRLEKQIEYLENDSSVGLVGTNYHVIDDGGRVTATTDVFTSPDDLKLVEVFFNHFGHGTIMARADLMTKHGYDITYKHAEDYDLWVRLSHEARIANLSEPLYQWRQHLEGVTTVHGGAMRAQAQRIRDREFEFFLNNKKKFKTFSFHPFSMRGGLRTYLSKKNSLYRDMALMFCLCGLRRKAVPFLLLAWVHAPWQPKTYKQLLITLFKKDSIGKIDYEPF